MNKDLKQLRKQVMWVCVIRPFQAEVTADAKTLKVGGSHLYLRNIKGPVWLVSMGISLRCEQKGEG